MKKKYLIILGCTGFIGRNLTQYFAQKKLQRVRHIFKKKTLKDKMIKFLKADLTNKNNVNRVLKNMDIVIRAAATTTGAKDIVSKPLYM